MRARRERVSKRDLDKEKGEENEEGEKAEEGKKRTDITISFAHACTQENKHRLPKFMKNKHTSKQAHTQINTQKYTHKATEAAIHD